MLVVRDFWYRPIARCRSVAELMERSGLTLDEILDAVAGSGYVRGVHLEPELAFITWLESIEPEYVPVDPVGPKVIADTLGISYSTVMRTVKRTRAFFAQRRVAA